MKFQLRLIIYSLFLSFPFLSNSRLNDDVYDFSTGQFRDKDTQTCYTIAAQEKLNHGDDSNSRAVAIMSAQEKLNEYRDKNSNSGNESSQTQNASNSGNSGSNRDSNGNDTQSDHERSMAVDNRREESLASRRSAQDGTDCRIRTNKYYDVSKLINYGKAFVEELIDNGQTKRLFTDKVITLTHHANLMLSELGFQELFKADIERYDKKEQSLFSLTNNLLNIVGALYIGYHARHIALPVANITILCAVSYDLIKHGELRPVPDLLKIGYSAIAKTNEYNIDFLIGMAEKAQSIARAPRNFIYEKVKGFWNLLTGAKKIVDFGDWLLCTNLSDMVVDVKDTLSGARNVVSSVSGRMSQMSADDWDDWAKATVKGAGGLTTDLLVVHFSCLATAPLLSKIGGLFKMEELAEAVEVIEEVSEVVHETTAVTQQAAASASRGKQYLEMIWDEALQAYVIEVETKSSAVAVVAEAAAIAQVAEKTLLPAAVQGPKIIGMVSEACAQVSPIVSTAGATTKIPQVVTAASAVVEGGNAVAKTAENVGAVEKVTMPASTIGEISEATEVAGQGAKVTEAAAHAFDIAKYDPSIGNLQKLQDHWHLIEKMPNYREIYDKIEKCGLIGKINGDLGTARGAMYELEKAVDIARQGEEIIQLGLKIGTREFDIVTKTRLIECKNIDWQGVVNKGIFGEQKRVADTVGKIFEVHSKQPIPQEWKNWFIKKSIIFFEG